jgi:cytochrome c oxidase subunit II
MKKQILAGLGVLVLIGAGCVKQQPAPTVTEPVVNNLPVEDRNEPVTTTPVVKPTPKPDPTPAVKNFTITAKNWEFTPGTITVKKGDKVRLTITSVDVDHGFTLSAFNVKVMLKPGETQVVEFTADKVGTFTFFCSVPCGAGHRDMKGTLIVE